MDHHTQATGTSSSTSLDKANEAPKDTQNAAHHEAILPPGSAHTVEDMATDQDHVPPPGTIQQSMPDSPSGPAQAAHQVNGNIHELNSKKSVSLNKEETKDSVPDRPLQPEESLSEESACTHRRYPSHHSPESGSDDSEPGIPLSNAPLRKHEFSRIGTWIQSKDTNVDYCSNLDISA